MSLEPARHVLPKTTAGVLATVRLIKRTYALPAGPAVGNRAEPRGGRVRVYDRPTNCLHGDDQQWASSSRND